MKTAVIALLLATSGCSVLVMRKPVERMPAPPECTSSRWAPGYDLLAAGASLFAAATAESSADDHGMGGGMRAIFAVSSVPYLISAMYGFSRASECKNLKARWEAEILPRVIR